MGVEPEETACMDVRIDWAEMRALESLTIAMGVFAFDHR